MSSSFEALLDVLDRLNEQHGTLLELAEQKRQALVKNEVDQLSVIVNKENKCVRQIDELNNQRIEATGQFMIEKGYKPNPRVTVSDLTKIIFQPEDKKRLMDAQKQVVATIRKLKTANQLNQQMIEHSLAFINYSVDLFVGDPEDDSIYRRPSQSKQGKKAPGLFDTRA